MTPALRSLTPTLAVLLCTREEMLSRFRLEGIDPSEWYPSPERDIAVKFLKTHEDYNYAVASDQVARDIHLLIQDAPVDLSVDFDSLNIFYQKAVQKKRAQDLAFQLQTEPEKADELIKRYQSKAAQGVGAFDLHDESEKMFSELLEKQRNKSIVRVIRDWEKLSEAIGGFNPGRLGILMARTGFGKTALGLNLVLSAQKTMRSVYVNMEMLPEDIFQRIVLLTNEIGFKDFVQGSERPSFETYELAVRGEGLLITDGSSMSLDKLQAFLRLEDQKRKLGFVVVDYDQKLELEMDRNTPEWKALQKAMVSLEELAKDLQIYVLVLAQEASEEGKISGSRRSTFPASTVMRFFAHENRNTYIVADFKNRFGPYGEGVRVNYRPECSKVEEVEAINVKNIEEQFHCKAQ